MKKYSRELRYFNFNKQVLLVEGAEGGLIQDLRNKKLYSIDAVSTKYLRQLLAGKAISDVISDIENSDKQKLLDYLERIVDKNLGFFSKVWIKNEDFKKQIYDKLDTVWLELRKACNLKCCHCYLDCNSNSDVNLELLNLRQWKDIILQLKQQKPKRIILIGGEPLLFKELVQLIEFIRISHETTDIVLYSNLTLLEEEVVDCIIKNKVRVVTSIYSSNSEVHDRITNRIGSFHKTVKSIKTLRNCGVYIQANAVIMNHNIAEIQNIQGFLYELTGRKGKLDIVRDVGAEKRNLMPDIQGLSCGRIKTEPNFKGISEAEFIKNFSGNSCWQGKINISCSGEISPCIMGERFINRKFNVKTHGINEILNEYLKKDLWSISRDNIEVCRDCEYRYVCKDCRPIAIEQGKLNGRGTICKYNPYKRKWEV